MKALQNRLIPVFTVVTLFLFGCQKSNPTQKQTLQKQALNDEWIRVGEIQTLTGSEAAFGTAIHRGMEMAVQRINQSGGIQGRKIKLITLDDQGKSEEAATAASQLISQHHVLALVGPLASSRSLAVAPIAQKSKIPMITPTATNPQVTEIGEFIFRVCFTDPFQGQVMAKFALQNLKLKKVAILQDIKSDYSIGLASFFAKTFKEGGGEIVVQQNLSAGDIDFKSQLTAIRAKAPEAIFVPVYYTEAALIARQAKELGIRVPLLGGDGWSSPKLVEIAGDAVENTYYSEHYANTDPSERVQIFIREFEKTYSVHPDGISALGYDALGILAEALQRSSQLDSLEIRNQLAKLRDFQGVTGKITMDQHRNPIKSAVILKLDRGVPVFQTRISP